MEWVEWISRLVYFDLLHFPLSEILSDYQFNWSNSLTLQKFAGMGGDGAMGDLDDSDDGKTSSLNHNLFVQVENLIGVICIEFKTPALPMFI